MTLTGKLRRVLTPATLLGVSAQCLTVASALLPVAFGQATSLVVLVQVSAPVAVAVATTSLSGMMLLPGISDEDEANEFLAVALLFILSSSVLVLLAAVLLHLVASLTFLAGICVGVGVMLPLQSAHMLFMAEMVRRADLVGMMITRLTYGAVTFTATLMACAVSESGVALVAATCTGLLAAALLSGKRNGLRVRLIAKGMRRGVGWDSIKRVMGRSGPLSTAQMVAGLCTQAPGLVVASLGPLSPFWAVVVRVVAGFQSVGGQLVGPRLDIAVSQALRTGSRRILGGRLRTAAVLSAMVGSGCCSAVFVALWWVGVFSEHVSGRFALMVAALLFGIAAGAQAPIDHLLGIVGSSRARIGWDVARAAATCIVLALLSGTGLILALGLLWIGALTTYAVLLWLKVASAKRDSAHL